MMIALMLILTAVVYGMGVRTLLLARRGHGIRRVDIASFALGMFVVAMALLSPLHEASEQIFSAHMVQHELLMVVAAPLMVVGHPGVTMLWAFPQAARRKLGAVVRNRAVRSCWSAVTRPFDAWLIHALAIWAWHVPLFFQATLRSEMVHAAQHLSFLLSALLFWWVVIHPRRRAASGLSIVMLFTTAVHTAVLGALMTFARSPWYPEYTGGAAAWGMTPVQDQQLAGLVMWIPASVAYLVAALVIARRWLRDSDLRVMRGEQVATC